MLIEEAEKFTINLLNDNLDTSFTYHNISHTQRVVESVKILAELSKIDEDKTNLLLVAAWLHDIGFTKNGKNHEEEVQYIRLSEN